ncbi:hypothetical protein HQ35_09705 [Porphyromonas cangingivalis]|uniref:Lipoprotein n=1 Tax=Porphyromonas cangingivalis TaxID=36874 RepID=A0A0A2EI24_PORCN|nr:DUF4876 domain-containing protein [Porphyromonas cangingivalis]KGN78486.1 hypothetical protein HQ35_09705 [Porphyromonas cangingivalis]
MKKSINQLLALTLLVGLALTGCIRKTNDDVSDSEKQLDHLVILEVFHTGSYFKTGEVKKKDGTVVDYAYTDARNKYIKIYNPTDKEMYLDKLALVTSYFGSTEPLIFVEASEDFRESFMAVSSIIYFPGNGTQYPIKPGEVKLLTAWAGDYTKPILDADGDEASKANPESFDFTGVTSFQWVTAEQMESHADLSDYPANPAVPYMVPAYPVDGEKAFTFSQSQTIALVKFDRDELSNDKINSHIKNFKLTVGTHGGGSANVDRTALVIPNSAIIDAVTIAPTERFLTTPVGKKIDAGAFATIPYVETNAIVAKRSGFLGKAMRRKHDGKKYVDDNNSTSDFEIVKAGTMTPDPLKP